MRLPADRREWLETLCRAGALALLLFMIARAFFPAATVAPENSVVRVSDLAAITRVSPSARLHFTLDGIPSSSQRAWQKALRAAGNTISWSGKASPLAVTARPNANPDGGYTVSAYTTSDSPIQVRDAISLIDSAPSQAHFISTPVAISSGTARTVVQHDSASVSLRDSVILRPVLVIGKAAWETKFVLAALEEAGWKTNAIISVAPSLLTTQGRVTAIDTAHYSALIAVDASASSRAPEIIAFVKSGGGLVLAEDAAHASAFAPLRVSINAPQVRQAAIGSDTISRGSAPFEHLDLKSDAVPIEQRGRNVAVAAMRVEFGRVIQTAFVDTWRWRMQGTEQSLIDHRDWWSALVSNVAYAPRYSFAGIANNGAPYADLVAVAGPPIDRPSKIGRVNNSINQLVWIVLLFALLLAEWTSRRLRGAR